ncbi:MAG TPA: DUF6351 family protein, partial [Casimicrobiaceae bacterium]|nr:DUF6351 family protein [Casimicrobiaceae bacterium]
MKRLPCRVSYRTLKPRSPRCGGQASVGLGKARKDGATAPCPEPQTLSSTPNSQCNSLYPSWRVARLVAGGPLSLSIMKCQLKPIDARD